jgi:hypothetical protein
MRYFNVQLLLSDKAREFKISKSSISGLLIIKLISKKWKEIKRLQEHQIILHLKYYSMENVQINLMYFLLVLYFIFCNL